MRASDPPSPLPEPPPELAAAEDARARTTTGSLLWIVLGVFVCLVLGLGLASFSLGYYSSRRFAGRAREAEGKLLLGALSRGITTCVETGGTAAANGAVGTTGLPPSAPAVPARLADVAQKGFRSAPSDWSDPTYRCAGFAVSEPQRFQIEWVLTSPGSGTVFARADEDGDGKADLVFEIDVRCQPAPEGGPPACTRGPDLRERR